MQIKIVNDAEGCPSVSVVNPTTGETSEQFELGLSQEVTITLAEVHDASGIEVGEVGPSSVGTTDGDGAEDPGGSGEAEPDGQEPAGV